MGAMTPNCLPSQTATDQLASSHSQSFELLANLRADKLQSTLRLNMKQWNEGGTLKKKSILIPSYVKAANRLKVTRYLSRSTTFRGAVKLRYPKLLANWC